MDDLDRNGVALRNISKINIVVGKNGSGKSELLRKLYIGLINDPERFHARYISPERTGVFLYESGIEQSMTNPGWLNSVRVKNQGDNFKQTSEHYLRQLEITFLRKMQSDMSLRRDEEKNFDNEYLRHINELLLNVRILSRPDRGGFLFTDLDGAPVEAAKLSSGESEAVCLATEIMHFFATARKDRTNVLLLDEPDVHQHPDLQDRLARLLVREFDRLPGDLTDKVVVVAATHSTALVCALATSPSTTLGTKHFGIDVVTQHQANQGLKKSLAFFGHPLSLAINGDPLMIMEGEDDERVWSQAARSSEGRIRLFPCLSESVNAQGELGPVLY